MKHFITGLELTKNEVGNIFDLIEDIKTNPILYSQSLKGKSIVTLYEKESLRTRLSFDIGINKLGGHAVYLDNQNGVIGKRESVKDFALNISTWADCIVARVNQNDTLVTLSEHSSVPVINSLCNLYHPCQALADFMTLKETFGRLDGLKLTYLGEGNNVSHSLMLLSAMFGVNFCAITPRNKEPNKTVFEKSKNLASKHNSSIQLSNDILDSKDSDVLYSDSWVSMGDNTTLEDAKTLYQSYQINQKLVNFSKASAVLHCQPAHRGYEITSEVIDGKKSKVLQQAKNRLYAQNALLLKLIGKN